MLSDHSRSFRLLLTARKINSEEGAVIPA
jgi:hypothetical protein